MASARKYDLIFFTATILEWKPLLSNNTYKDVIVDSLRFFVINGRIQINAFVIMDNHLHLIWQILQPNKYEDVQRDFLRFTAKTFVKHLKDQDQRLLNSHYVNAKDRKYQIWERNSLSVGIWSEDVLRQKLDYIHNNPVKAGCCTFPEEYRYSTAALYNGLEHEWDFITPCFV